MRTYVNVSRCWHPSMKALLTVEYLDLHDAYHGVVFVLLVKKAAAARDQILAKLTPPVAVAASSCDEPLPNSVMVEPIRVDGV